MIIIIIIFIFIIYSIQTVFLTNSNQLNQGNGEILLSLADQCLYGQPYDTQQGQNSDTEVDLHREWELWTWFYL